MRILFSALFLLLQFYSMFNTENKHIISDDECIRDETFLLTAGINEYLVHHIDTKNRYIIYASFLMDFMILTFIACFYLYWKTYRVIFAYVLFFGARTLV